MQLIRSKQRVADHGEVFTPPWMSDTMIALVKDEAKKIESRFLEPSCGDGAFLTRILELKIQTVKREFGKKSLEMPYYALIALMSTYGIEVLPDNVYACRENMLDVLSHNLSAGKSEKFFHAASYVLSQNIVHGDALTMRTNTGRPIVFAEWKYMGKGKYQRRDFRLDALSHPIVLAKGSSVPSESAENKILIPFKTYPLMSLNEMAVAGVGGAAREAG